MVVTLRSWYGTCKSAITLAMYHKLSGTPAQGLNDHSHGEQHPDCGSQESAIL